MKDTKSLLNILGHSDREGVSVLILYMSSEEICTADVIEKMDALASKGVVERFIRVRIGSNTYKEYKSICDIPEDLADRVMSLEVRYRLV